MSSDETERGHAGSADAATTADHLLADMAGLFRDDSAFPAGSDRPFPHAEAGTMVSENSPAPVPLAADGALARRSAASVGPGPPEVGLRRTIEQMLEAFAVPALIVDRRGSVVAANRGAVSRLDEASILRLDACGHLRARDSGATSRILVELRRICRAGSVSTADLAIRSSDGEVAAALSIVPLPLCAQGSCEAGGDICERLALVMIYVLVGPPEPNLRLLRHAFRLTAAETGLVAYLASGRSLGGAADALHIGKETARTHLRSVFAKTGTHRQAELAALLARLPPANPFTGPADHRR